MSRADLLFNEHRLSEVIEAQRAAMLQAVDSLAAERILGTGVDELARYFEKQYELVPPILHEEAITVDQHETGVDVSHEWGRAIRDRSRPVLIPGTTVEYHVPFDGDPDLFACQPSQSTFNPPRGRILGSELILSFTRTDHDAAAMRVEFDRELSSIKSYLSTISHDVQGFNASLLSLAQQRVQTRREKLLKDDALAAASGFPLRRRAGAAQTYVVPEVRRKMPPTLPPVSSRSPSEPTLDQAEYEHILSIMRGMVTVMERSPSAFRDMREEDIRQHFLVQLNGQYDGQATGETFNFEGRTDILIRARGKNIFIAECKFWSGPKSLVDAIEQILGYVSWRDTKMAVLLFNRTKNLSAVLSKVPETLRAHPCFVRADPSFNADTAFRCFMHHRDDALRELVLTVMVFEVPKPE